MGRSLALAVPLAIVTLLASASATEGCAWTTSVTDDTQIVVDARPSGESTFFLAFDYYIYDICNVPSVGPGTDLRLVVNGEELARAPLPATVHLGECLFSLWTYYETNGIDGLQRGDDMHDDTCGRAEIDSDTIPF